MIIVWNLDEYYTHILMGLSPVALRTLILLLARLAHDGSSTATLVELRRSCGHNVSNISLGIKELLERDLIRRKSLSSYWISDRIAYNLNFIPGNS